MFSCFLMSLFDRGQTIDVQSTIASSLFKSRDRSMEDQDDLHDLANHLEQENWPLELDKHMREDIEDLSGDDFAIVVKDKIIGAEKLGVWQAFQDGVPNLKAIFLFFSWAILFREDENLLDVKLKETKLVKCFSKISLKECRSKTEIDSVKDSVVGLKAHAFLVGDRIYGNSIYVWNKMAFLYPHLVSFAKDLFNEKMWEEGFGVLHFVLDLECTCLDNIKLGVVASFLAKGWKTFAEGQLKHARELLYAYESVLMNVTKVKIHDLISRSDSLMDSFGRILFDEAFHCSTGDDLEFTLLAIERLLRVVRSRIFEENPEEYQQLSSVTFKVMEHLVDNLYAEVDFSSFLRVKNIMLNVFRFDSPSYMDSSGNTVLHLVASCVCPELENLEYLQDLARTFVEHGCPINVKNHEGNTASSILEKDKMYNQEDYPILLWLVSPQTAAL